MRSFPPKLETITISELRVNVKAMFYSPVFKLFEAKELTASRLPLECFKKGNSIEFRAKSD
jgi:hypothetical protein